MRISPLPLAAILLTTVAAAVFTPEVHARTYIPSDHDQKELKTFIQCDLRDTPTVSCEEVIQGFFTAYGLYFTRSMRPSDASLHLTLTDQAVPGKETLYTFSWAASDEPSVSAFSYTTGIDPDHHDRVATLNQLVLNITKGASVYVEVLRGEVDDGNLTVVYGNSEESAPSKGQRFRQGPFYFDVTANINGSQSSTTEVKNNVFMGTANYSGKKLRVQLSAQKMGFNQKIPAQDGGSLTAGFRIIQSAAIASYSFKQRWSVAIIANYVTAPAQNIESASNQAVGLEWNLIPFRTTETRELYFRAGTGMHDLTLGAENDLGFTSDRFMYGFAQIYTYWSMAKSKLNASLQAQMKTYPKFSGYEIYSANSTLNYQISPAIRLTGTYSYSYQAKSLMFPKEPDYSNPLKTMYLAGAPGSSSTYTIGIGVTLGNSLKRTRDRRWADFNNN